MTKRLLFLFAVATFFMGAQFVNAQGITSKKDAEAAVASVSVDDFADKADAMVGKTVQIKGMVTHVCKHGGNKMFIMTDDPDVQVKITTGEKIASFPTELEGSMIWVKGVVQAQDVEVEEEDHEDHDEDAAHKNIYHVKQYSLECLEYKVSK